MLADAKFPNLVSPFTDFCLAVGSGDMSVGCVMPNGAFKRIALRGSVPLSAKLFNYVGVCLDDAARKQPVIGE